MKLLKKSLLTIASFLVAAYSPIYAAGIDHFEVKLNPNSAKVWESLDLEIEAVDKNNMTVSDYVWEILIFSESDPEVELPSSLQENTYMFEPADQWKVKFENAVKFKANWLQDIHIYDLNDNTVYWVWEATIEKVEKPQNIDITIESPENGLTIWEDSITISWISNKNHQIKIIVNWSDEISTTTNNDWIFETTATWLNAWDNGFVAQILDSDWKKIWESSEVKIKVQLNELNIKNVAVNPAEVDAENSYEIEVTANPWLKEVTVIVNDIVTTLSETKSWVYTEKLTAPTEAWTYKVDVEIKDDIGHAKRELGTASLTVNEIILESAPEEEEVEEVIEEVDNTEEEKKSLEITWLKLVELKSKSVLTWDEVEEAESYNVYKKVEDWELELVENVSESKFEVEITWDEIKYDFFAVKAVSKTASWEIYEWDLSEATKVKTWPEVIILFILSLIIWGLFVIMSRRRA